MISSPFQQKGPRTIPTLPNKRSRTRNPILSSKKGLARSQPFSIANLCSFRSAVQLQNLIGFLELHHIDLLDRLVNGHSAPVHNAGEDE